jgi:hypothetical protein
MSIAVTPRKSIIFSTCEQQTFVHYILNRSNCLVVGIVFQIQVDLEVIYKFWKIRQAPCAAYSVNWSSEVELPNRKSRVFALRFLIFLTFAKGLVAETPRETAFTLD